MTSIFSENLQERDNKPSKWLKTDELLAAEGLKIKSVDVVEAKNYGAEEGDSLFEKGVLQEGETIRYSFEDSEGNERLYDSKGAGLYIAMKQAKPESGVVVKITRSGKGDKTRYQVNV